MAAVCEMDESQLITELLAGLANDINALRSRVEKLPTQPPADYGASIAGLTKAVQELQSQIKPAPAAVDLSAITTRLDRIEQLSRQRPEYKMSRYVQYGAYGFGLMVVLLVTSVWFALSWRSERDEYLQAYTQDNWRVRYTKQANADFYAYMEGVFAKEAPKVQQWTLEQEQADQKRELARQAAEQAKAMNAQADQLEGKASTRKKTKPMKTRFDGPRADYTYSVEGAVIAIVDLDLGSKSVTNDMDKVLDDIRAELGDLTGYAVIYRDSMSRWDGVRLVGRAVEFYSLNETDPERAASRLLHLLG